MNTSTDRAKKITQAKPWARRHWVGYGLLVALLMVAFAGVAYFYQSRLDQYQQRRPRYAPQRAIDALDQGQPDLAAQEIAQLLQQRPIQGGGFLGRQISDVWEGAVLRNRVQAYEGLIARLMQADRFEEARQVAWKNILEYHIASRSVEDPIPWELLYHIDGVLAASGDDQRWVSTFEIARILGAHGAKRVRYPSQIQPSLPEVDNSYFQDLRRNFPPLIVESAYQFSTATSANDFYQAAKMMRNALKQTDNPLLSRMLNGLIHRSLVAGRYRKDARQMLGELWGQDPQGLDAFWASWPSRQTGMNLLERDPNLLGMMWRDRPASAKQSIVSYLESFQGDGRLRVLDFGELESLELGYFNPGNRFSIGGDRSVSFYQNKAGRLRVNTSKPIRRIYLTYEAKPVLGVYPILLLSINEESYIPIYCDSSTPEMIAIDVDLPSANYVFDFVYLNDCGFQMKNVEENRDLTLHRMVLVHVPPTQ